MFDLFLTCSKHAPNVSVSFIKAMVCDVVEERGAMEEHPLIGVVVVGLRDLLSTVHVLLPHPRVHHSLNLHKMRKKKL